MLLSRSFLLLSSSFVLTSLAFAAGKGGGIDAQVKDLDAKALKATQVRIEPVDKKAKAIVVRPDAKGHVAVNGLEAGSYRIIAVVDGKAQSMQTVKVAATGSTSAVLKVNKAATTKTVASSNSGSKSMYHPGQVGSRFGGYWQQKGEKKKPQETGAENVDDANGDAMDDAQRQQRYSAPPATGGR